MNGKPTLPGIAAIVLGFSSAPAMAELLPMTGFYFGAGFGQADYALSQGTLDGQVIDAIGAQGFTLVDGSSDVRNEDYGYNAFLGYRIIDNLAIEGSYYDLGKADYSADFIFNSGTGTPEVLGSDRMSREAKGPALCLVGILPFDGPWEVFVRAGLFFSDVKVDHVRDINGPVDFNSSSSDQETMYGAGGTFHIGEHISIRGEYTKFMKLGNEATTEKDLTMLSLHFLWRL